MHRFSVKPIVYIAAAPERVRGNHGFAETWQEILDTPQPVLLQIDGGFPVKMDDHAILAGAKDWVRDYLGPIAPFWPVHRVQPENVLLESEVLAELWQRAPAGKMAEFARRVGISKVLLTRIRNGDARPGTAILEPMGLLRLPLTNLYIRRTRDLRGWKSDFRGGKGGTVSQAA